MTPYSAHRAVTLNAMLLMMTCIWRNAKLSDCRRKCKVERERHVRIAACVERRGGAAVRLQRIVLGVYLLAPRAGSSVVFSAPTPARSAAIHPSRLGHAIILLGERACRGPRG